MPQDRFEKFRTLLKKSKRRAWFQLPGKPKRIREFYSYGSEIPPGPWLANWEAIVPIALTIMESQEPIIFYDGMLYGGIAKKDKIQSEHKYYEIIDVDLFILRASHLLYLDLVNRSITSPYNPLITYLFNKVLADFEIIAHYLTKATKTIRRDRIRTIKNDIVELKKYSLLKSISPKISFNYDVAKQITIILKHHIPKAPKEVIPYRVTELLGLFNMEIAPETIRDWLKYNKLPASYFTL